MSHMTITVRHVMHCTAPGYIYVRMYIWSLSELYRTTSPAWVSKCSAGGNVNRKSYLPSAECVLRQLHRHHSNLTMATKVRCAITLICYIDYTHQSLIAVLCMKINWGATNYTISGSNHSNSTLTPIDRQGN